MLILLKICGFLIAFFILVLVHEFGHFVAAKRMGVKVIRFAIGFGKAIFKWNDRSGTEYVLAPILLGGYVKLLDSTEETVKKEDLPRAFDQQSIYKRTIIIFAGIFFNIVFAFLAFWLMFAIGFKAAKPVVGEVFPATKAFLAGLKPGDEIQAIDGVNTTNWQDVSLALFKRMGDSDDMVLQVRRGNQLNTQALTFHLKGWVMDTYSPDPLKSLGFESYQPLLSTEIMKVQKDSVADQAGIKIGDKILAIDGKKVNSWKNFTAYIEPLPKQNIALTIKRGREILVINLTTGWRFGEGWKRIGYLGVQSQKTGWPLDMIREFKYSPLTSLTPALRQVIKILDFNYLVFAKLISGKISLHMLGGPIAIMQSAASAIEQGPVIYIGYLAILSLTLAVVNLLPIPLLDGGYVLFLFLEMIMKKPVSRAAQLLMYRVGLIVLLLIFFHATVNDLVRILA